VPTDTEALVRRAYHLAEGDVLDVQGFIDLFDTPAGVIQPTGAKLDIPTADFWYVRDGKIQEFNCHIGTTTRTSTGSRPSQVADLVTTGGE
jgi:ketosteroid isomerase-like protein